MLPTMPRTGDEGHEAESPQRKKATPKKPPTRAEAVRAARARITRRHSLKLQREAQKD